MLNLAEVHPGVLMTLNEAPEALLRQAKEILALDMPVRLVVVNRPGSPQEGGVGLEVGFPESFHPGMEGMERTVYDLSDSDTREQAIALIDRRLAGERIEAVPASDEVNGHGEAEAALTPQQIMARIGSMLTGMSDPGVDVRATLAEVGRMVEALAKLVR